MDVNLFISTCHKLASELAKFPPGFYTIIEMAEYIIWVTKDKYNTCEDTQKAFAVLSYCMHEVCNGTYAPQGVDHPWKTRYESIQRVQAIYAYWAAGFNVSV